MVSVLKRKSRLATFYQNFKGGMLDKFHDFSVVRIIICFIVLTILFLGSTTPIYSQKGPPVILLLVDSTLSLQLGTSYTTFKKDLANEGYVISEEIMNSNTRPPEIKEIIHLYYSSTTVALNGVILIGNLKAPYAIIKCGDYSNPDALKLWVSLDAIDMYYGDMDGKWDQVTADEFNNIIDNPPSNIAELYREASCSTFINEYIVDFDKEKVWDYQSVQNKNQYSLEIWVSRIMAHNLSITDKTENDILDDYFSWNHTFRTGGYTIPETCFMLNATGSDCNDQGMDYSDIFEDIITAGDVSKQSYLPYLQEESGSRLFYATIHSCPGWHQFSDGLLLTTNELLNIKKTGVFYMLNCCSGCRWDEFVSFPANPNYLGGMYVFDKSDEGGGFGVAAMGFTGVGGFNNLNYFTEYYNDFPYANYGEMYVYWFNRNIQINFMPMNYVCLGDMTIGPDTPLGGTSVSQESLLSSEYYLSQNYPNPFNSLTTFKYKLINVSDVILTICDINGRVLETLINSRKDSGYHTVHWNAEQYSSGVYFYQIKAGDFQQVRKCLLIK